MISTSDKYKQQLIQGNRNYVVKAELTLADETELTLTNEQLWEQGVIIDNAISSDSSFDIGSAIVGNLKLIIDNITGAYSAYDFINARIVLWIGVTGDLNVSDEQVYYRIGYYVVDDTEYNGSLITLDCLDNMTWFDVPFKEITSITYPTTAGQIVSTMCSHVGVTLSVAHFPNYDRTISAESGEWLDDNDVNCREVLQYIAQKCCCYCKIDTAGQLVLTWYDKTLITGLHDYDGGTFVTNTTPYSDGDDLDGGNFLDYTSGDSADGGTFLDLANRAWLSRNYDMSVSVEDIVVTGCRVVSNSGGEDSSYDELWVDSTLEQTHDRYVLVIQDNPLIVKSEASVIASQIGGTLAGLQIRAFNSNSLNDLSYETGDMVTLVDFRGNVYYTWITHLTFTVSNSESFSCGAESVRKRNETRFSESAKTLAEAKQNANKLISDYDNAVKAMNELAQSAIGYNQYQHAVGAGIVTWLYNGTQIDTTDAENPLFPNSTVVFKISGDGVFISNDGGTTYTQGYDANSGTAILSLLYAVGLSADWIKAGTIELGIGNTYNSGAVLKAYTDDVVANLSIVSSTVGATIDLPSMSNVTNDTPLGIYVDNIGSTGTLKGFSTLYVFENNEWVRIESLDFVAGTNYFSTILDHTKTYYIYCYVGHTTVGAATYDATVFISVLNTTIDSYGVTTSNVKVTGGEVAGLTVDYVEKGFSLNERISGRESYFKMTGWGGITAGAKINNSWQRMDWVQEYGMLHVNYGNSSHSDERGICVSKSGVNDYRPNGSYTRLSFNDLVSTDNGSVAWTGSDRRLKKNIEDLTLEESEELVYSVRPRKFEFKSQDGERYGFIAQELREILSDDSAIEYESENADHTKNIHYNDFIAPLCMIVKKQQAEIDLLKQELAELKARTK